MHIYIYIYIYTYIHSHIHTAEVTETLNIKIIAAYIYSKNSLNRPLTVMDSHGPFREVIDLENLPQHRKDTVLLISVM